MKTFIKFSVLSILLLISVNIFSLSDGAFNMTGAPGEGDCSGCHSGNSPNSDPNGSITITIDSSNGEYIPGKTYDVKVRVSHLLRNRFGFALTTRKANSTDHLGNFYADTASGVFNRTEMVAHRRASIDASQQRTWNFKWQAPLNETEDITIYAAGVAANGDNGNDGDLAYTTFVKLKKSGTNTGIKNFAEENSADFSAYPIPTNKYLNIKQTKTLHHIVQLSIYNQLGEEVETWNDKELLITSDHTIRLDLKHPKGIYYLKIKTITDTFIYKFFLAQ